MTGLQSSQGWRNEWNPISDWMKRFLWVTGWKGEKQTRDENINFRFCRVKIQKRKKEYLTTSKDLSKVVYKVKYSRCSPMYWKYLRLIDNYPIWRHSRLNNQWGHIIYISTLGDDFSVHWSASRVFNVISYSL